MTRFEMMLQSLFGKMPLYENDPGFGFRIYKLPDEDQARIYRITRKPGSPHNPPPPDKGVFVAATIHPDTKQLVLAYSAFPKGGSESVQHTALAYDDRELAKAPKQIAEWLIRGVVPVADGEYA